MILMSRLHQGAPEMLIYAQLRAFFLGFWYSLLPAIKLIVKIIHEVMQSCVKHKSCSFPASSDCLCGLRITALIASLTHRYAALDMNGLLSACWMGPCFTSADSDSNVNPPCYKDGTAPFLSFAALPGHSGSSFPQRLWSVRQGVKRRIQVSVPPAVDQILWTSCHSVSAVCWVFFVQYLLKSIFYWKMMIIIMS